MIHVLPGWTHVALFPGAPMIRNPFPIGTTLYLIWSEVMGKRHCNNWCAGTWTITNCRAVNDPEAGFKT